jgi:uncharacterized membrane protein
MINLDIAAYTVLFFFIFSFCGWLFECAISLFRDHEIVNRGFYNGPYCPIYGAGALLFLLIMQWTDRPLELFFFGGLIACVLEYLTSWLMEKLYKARWWDYSNWPFNINGRVCLYGFLTFGAFSALMPFMKNGIDWLINLIPSQHRLTVAAIILGIFVIDFIYSNHIIISFNRSLRKIQKQLSKSFPLNIINRGKRAILFLKIGDKKYKLLTWQQRRLLNAFPGFKSKYDKALRTLTAKRKQKLDEFQKNRFKPISSRELKAAKAKAKREGKKLTDARKSNKY